MAHEITHSWQHQHNSNSPNEDEEGHAMYVQQQFANDVGWSSSYKFHSSLVSLFTTGKATRHKYLNMPHKYKFYQKDGIDGPSEAFLRSTKDNKIGGRVSKKNILEQDVLNRFLKELDQPMDQISSETIEKALKHPLPKVEKSLQNLCISF